MNGQPSPQVIALANDLQNVLNKHDLTYKESFMVVNYLSVMIARTVNMPLDKLIEVMTEVYKTDEALDRGIQ